VSFFNEFMLLFLEKKYQISQMNFRLNNNLIN
jgi:hypothetical protein